MRVLLNSDHIDIDKIENTLNGLGYKNISSSYGQYLLINTKDKMYYYSTTLHKGESLNTEQELMEILILNQMNLLENY